ncbi:MAG: elongation factor Ts, partial [Bdellovibrionales bacterium]|nr:elongation factor Ts [Bdellovibrionales bacterium]
AANPRYLTAEDVPASILDKEKEILIEQLEEKQKAMADKILPGKLKKFYEDNVLLQQIFVRDDTGKLTIQQMIDDLGVKVGEKVSLRRFQRFEVGEGIEVEKVDFAQEVAAAMG